MMPLSQNYSCLSNPSYQIYLSIYWLQFASAGDLRQTGSIPESGRSPGRGHGNPLQYSCLEKPMNRGAW